MLILIIIMSFDLPLPDNFNRYPQHLKDEVLEYLNDFDELDKEAYMVAFTILKSGFNIAKSNGFLEWKKEKKAQLEKAKKEQLEKEQLEMEKVQLEQLERIPIVKNKILVKRIKKSNT